MRWRCRRRSGAAVTKASCATSAGELTECASNLFIVQNGALTPPLAAGILPGITREHLFDIGHEIGVDIREQTLHDDDLFAADEAFLTGTTREPCRS